MILAECSLCVKSQKENVMLQAIVADLAILAPPYEVGLASAAGLLILLL